MIDTDPFCTQEILAMTALGESESLGSIGMQQTLNTVMNRAKANKPWMGGSDLRQICLQKGQYDVWDQGSKDRERVISIGLSNPLYGPYRVALGLSGDALAGDLPDITNFAVSYVDNGAHASVHPGSQPCLVVGNRVFYGLKAVA
jgi:hypothetical protein